MARNQKKDRKKADGVVLPIMKPDAAGIDIGATEIYVAVPADRDAETVRCFPDIHAGFVCSGCLAATMRDQDRGDGIHRCVLDSVVPDFGGSRLRGVSGECATREERTRATDRRFRL